MPDADVEERLRAVERALTDGEPAPADLSDAAEVDRRLARVEDRLDDLEARVAEAEGGIEAVRGYVGSVRAVNREVERRADAALAAVEEVPAPETGTPDRPDDRDDAGTDLRERLRDLW